MNSHTKLWAWLLMRKTLNQPLASAIAKLTDDQARYMVRFIENMDGPLNQLLDAWGLPRLEGPGFWKGEVLPLLKNRLAPKRPASTYRGPSRQYESFKEIKARLDIVEVAGRYTDLKPAGRLYKGLCPFHVENTPSFTVYPDNQSFYCFGCLRGGDVIELTRLLMEIGKW